MKTKIELPVLELRRLLPGLAKVVNRRSGLPALGCVQVVSTGEHLILTRNDLDCYVSAKIEAAQPEASVLIPFDTLSQVASVCSSDCTMRVEATTDTLTLAYSVEGTMVALPVPLHPASDFPSIPEVTGKPKPVAEAFADNLRQALRCCSDDSSRHVLQGVYLDVSQDCHTLVSTDGRHLYAANSITLPIRQSVILPVHKLWGWKGLVRDGEWRMAVEKKEEVSWIRLETDHWSITVRGVEGDYPNWRQVMPDAKPLGSMTFAPEAVAFLRSALAKLPCHDSVNHPIGICAGAGKVSVFCKATAESKWTSIAVADAVSTGDITVQVNRGLFVKALEFGLTRLDFTDSISPVRFVAPGKQLIVMPLRGDISNVPNTHEIPSNPNPRNETMPITPDQPRAGTAPVEANPPAIQQAVEHIEQIKDTLKGAVRGLNELLDTLKQAQRENRSSEREIESVRSTLRSLQKVSL